MIVVAFVTQGFGQECFIFAIMRLAKGDPIQEIEVRYWIEW